ncbi:MAG: hypothetical protein WCV55_00630 [Candidatus Paceibacterota bacterium]
MTKIQSKILLIKPTGETPLECLKRFKAGNPEYSGLPMTYAGRLDPMAEGLLLLLVGEECKKKDDYLYLSKEYEVEVLFGFETDTGDLLGKVVRGLASHKKGRLSLAQDDIQSVLEQIKSLPQKYPAYSSKTFEGKPLWQWAREGEEKEVESNAKITDIVFLERREISAQELLQNIELKISKVTGDFRQEEILRLWRENLQDNNFQFSILKLKVSSTGGAYMRVLAQGLGKIIGVPSLAYSIKRTRIGDYTH